MLNLEKQFQIAETRRVPCPWLPSVVFEIRWFGCQQFADWTEKHAKDSPGYKDLNALLAKASSIASVKTARVKGKDRTEVYQKAVADEYASLVAKANIGEIQFEEYDPEGIARCLVMDVIGLEEDGAPLEYTPELGVRLMNVRNPTQEDVRLEAGETEDEDANLFVPAGSAAGTALKRWIIWEALRQDLFRQQWIEGAEGN